MAVLVQWQRWSIGTGIVQVWDGYPPGAVLALQLSSRNRPFKPGSSSPASSPARNAGAGCQWSHAIRHGSGSGIQRPLDGYAHAPFTVALLISGSLCLGAVSRRTDSDTLGGLARLVAADETASCDVALFHALEDCPHARHQEAYIAYTLRTASYLTRLLGLMDVSSTEDVQSVTTF
jgi:hypothetical protein